MDKMGITAFVSVHLLVSAANHCSWYPGHTNRVRRSCVLEQSLVSALTVSRRLTARRGPVIIGHRWLPWLLGAARTSFLLRVRVVVDFGLVRGRGRRRGARLVSRGAGGITLLGRGSLNSDKLFRRAVNALLDRRVGLDRSACAHSRNLPLP
jgi:hypothetical protein